jgi:hypothetical protein
MIKNNFFQRIKYFSGSKIKSQMKYKYILKIDLE